MDIIVSSYFQSSSPLDKIDPIQPAYFKVGCKYKEYLVYKTIFYKKDYFC